MKKLSEMSKLERAVALSKFANEQREARERAEARKSNKNTTPKELLSIFENCVSSS